MRITPEAGAAAAVSRGNARNARTARKNPAASGIRSIYMIRGAARAYTRPARRSPLTREARSSGATMPVQKDPSGRRFVAVEAEVPGTPEEVWQAIATGPGITAWFVPAKVDGRAKGSMVLTFGPGMESEGEIQTWDSPRRFTVENKEGMGPGSPTVTDEWTIEAKPGGTCRVRVVHAWSASGDEWNKHFESVEKGWPAFFLILKRYLARFRGQPCAQIQLMAFAPGPKDKTWAAITHPLGLVEA